MTGLERLRGWRLCLGVGVLAWLFAGSADGAPNATRGANHQAGKRGQTQFLPMNGLQGGLGGNQQAAMIAQEQRMIQELQQLIRLQQQMLQQQGRLGQGGLAGQMMQQQGRLGQGGLAGLGGAGGRGLGGQPGLGGIGIGGLGGNGLNGMNRAGLLPNQQIGAAGNAAHATQHKHKK